MPKRKNNPIIQPMPYEGFVRLPQVLHVFPVNEHFACQLSSCVIFAAQFHKDEPILLNRRVP